MVRFNDILRAEGIDPARTAVCLHTPRERALARLLPLFAETEPALFEAYQGAHSVTATRTLRKRDYMASFVRIESGTLVFVGVYRNRGARERPRAEIRTMPEIDRLIRDLGAYREFEDTAGPAWLWFDLELTGYLGAYRGRLQIAPRLTQAYMRLAEKLDAEVVALSRDSELSAAAPDWQSFIVTGPEMRLLPANWASRLREWRGVYLIVDETDGQRYVGSAYGADNLLARWRAHVANDRGTTARLRARDPANFRFSILQTVDPNLTAEDLIAIENSWKERLHTREFGLNEN